MSEKEFNADDILAESDDDDDDDNGSQASGEQIKLPEPQKMKQELEESKWEEAEPQHSRGTILAPEQMRNRSGGFALNMGAGAATAPVDDSDSDGDRGRGRAGALVLAEESGPREEEEDEVERRRSGAVAEDALADDRRRSGAISLSSELRKSKDDTILQDPLGHADPDMMRVRANSKGRMTRTFTVVGSNEENQIFAENLNIAESPAKVDIDKRSNSKGENEKLLDDIMNEPDDSSSQDDKDKAEEEEADDGAKDQKKGTQKSKGDSYKEFNEDDEISEGERRRILEELEDSDDEEGDDDDDYGGESDSDSDGKSGQDGGDEPEDDSMSDASLGDLANKSIDSGPQELQDVVDKSNYLPFIS